MNNRTDEIRSVAFPTLTDDQIAFLKRYGKLLKTEAGQVLFKEGGSVLRLHRSPRRRGGDRRAGLSGSELASRALVQADKFGARTTVPQEAISLRRENDHCSVALSEGGEVAGRSVIVATGARYRRLDLPRLERFEGVSVHYAGEYIANFRRLTY